MGDISKNFSFSEFESSQTAFDNDIDNTIPESKREKVRDLVICVLQPARDFLGSCITITSGYRCKALNYLLVRSNHSQHVKGEAADLVCSDNMALFRYIRDNLYFDQLIYEFGDDNQPKWVHVSFNMKYNRNEVLKAEKRDGKTVYIKLN